MSISEIAKRAGVSTATVSRVINSYPSVSESNIRRVNKAMEGLGYKVKPASRGGRRSELDCVALLWTSTHMFDPYSSVGHMLVRGASEALAARNMGLILSYIVDASDVPAFVERGKVRGAIVTGHNPRPELVEKLRRVPHVWINSHRSRGGDVVLAGNDEVGRLAAEHLVARGHRRLAVFNVLTETAAETRVRYFAYVAADLGVPVSTYCAQGDHPQIWANEMDAAWFESVVAAQVDRLLSEPRRATGVFMPSDFQAAMFYRVLAKRGVRPGVDLEVVSSDVEVGATMGLYPRPTTIDLGARAVGRRAVDQLMTRITSPEEENVRVLLEPRLVHGDYLREDWAGVSESSAG